jgi:hypothetical protein
MRCGICGRKFPFDPDMVLEHAFLDHELDLVECYDPDEIVLDEREWHELSVREGMRLLFEEKRKEALK